MLMFVCVVRGNLSTTWEMEREIIHYAKLQEYLMMTISSYESKL